MIAGTILGAALLGADAINTTVEIGTGENRIANGLYELFRNENSTKQDFLNSYYVFKDNVYIISYIYLTLGLAAAESGFPTPNSMSGTGVLDNANYAQKTYSNTFSREGRKIYSELVGEPINTIDDLASAINSGKVNVAEIPVDYIVRDGKTLILNTRTSQALTQAGIPRNQWNIIDGTGDPLFENLLTEQSSRNNLTLEGISTIRPSGGQ